MKPTTISKYLYCQAVVLTLLSTNAFGQETSSIFESCTKCGNSLEWLSDSCPNIGIYTGKSAKADLAGHIWFQATLTKILRGKPPDDYHFDYPPTYDHDLGKTYMPTESDRFMLFFRNDSGNALHLQQLINLANPSVSGYVDRIAFHPDFSLVKDGGQIEEIVNSRISRVTVTPIPLHMYPTDIRKVEVPVGTSAYKVLITLGKPVFLIVPEDLVTLPSKHEKE